MITRRNDQDISALAGVVYGRSNIKAPRNEKQQCRGESHRDQFNRAHSFYLRRATLGGRFEPGLFVPFTCFGVAWGMASHHWVAGLGARLVPSSCFWSGQGKGLSYPGMSAGPRATLNFSYLTPDQPESLHKSRYSVGEIRLAQFQPLHQGESRPGPGNQVGHSSG